MKNYRLLLLLIAASVFIHLFVNDYNYLLAITEIFLQLLVSWIISYVFTQFFNKYYHATHQRVWSFFYGFMAVGTLIWYFWKD